MLYGKVFPFLQEKFDVNIFLKFRDGKNWKLGSRPTKRTAHS